MIINKYLFSRFLELVCLKGNIINNELLLNIKKDEIKALLVSTDKTVAVEAVLNGDFEDIGLLGIGDLITFKKFINNFQSNQINLSKTKNKLILKTKSQIRKITLINPDYIKNNLPEEKFDLLINQINPDILSIPASVVKNIIKDFELNASKKKEENYLDLKSTGKELILKFFSDNLNEVENIENIDSNIICDIRLGQVFIDVLSTIGSDNIDISVGKQAILIKLVYSNNEKEQSTDNFVASFKFIVAQRSK